MKQVLSVNSNPPLMALHYPKPGNHRQLLLIIPNRFMFLRILSIMWTRYWNIYGCIINVVLKMENMRW